jgi:hypothetical protein
MSVHSIWDGFNPSDDFCRGIFHASLHSPQVVLTDWDPPSLSPLASLADWEFKANQPKGFQGFDLPPIKRRAPPLESGGKLSIEPSTGPKLGSVSCFLAWWWEGVFDGGSNM